MMKKIMLLGGLRYLLPVIEAAHQQGYYVITADYLPDNIAHKYSNEYCYVSIIDKEAVLSEARRLKIDGIMSFACDPGVVAASYVQNQLGLPSFGPFESVEILQNKDKFRAFLTENGFNVPNAKGYSSVKEALSDAECFAYPIIVKPTDSAGSKGVTRVDEKDGLKEAVEYAFSKSLFGHIIIEDFIEKVGCSSDSECFSEDGKLVFVSYNAQRFDDKAINPYTPAAFSWPSTFTKGQEDYLTSELQRLLTLLEMKTCVYNVETRIGLDGKPYIMEVSPRGGGNRLCEMLRYATDVDLITAITRYCVGDNVPRICQQAYNGHWAEVILHSDETGIFVKLEVSRDIKEKIIEQDLWVNCGDWVHSFEGANDTIGTLVLKFDSEREMEEALNNVGEIVKVRVKN